MRRKKDSELIYETALGFFSRYGYKKTTLEDIATGLNMSNSNIYSYADSKRSLYYDCIEYAVERWQTKVFDSINNNLEAANDPVKRLRLSFKVAADHLLEDEALCNLIRKDSAIFPLSPTIDPTEKYNNVFIDYICDILKDGIAKGVFQNLNPQETAIIVFNIYKSLVIESYLRQGKEDMQNYFQTTLDLLQYGIIKR